MALEFDADFNGYFDDSYGHGVSATYTVSVVVLPQLLKLFLRMNICQSMV